MPSSKFIGGGNQPVEKTSFRNSISVESQFLSVGAGFVVFVALLAFFATIHRAKKRRNSARLEFKSPLIQHAHLGGSLKSNSSAIGKVGTKNFRPQQCYQVSPPSSQLQSPHGSDSSGGSPQCTPLTPYSSFSMTSAASQQQHSPGYHQQETVKIDNLKQVWTDVNRGSISLQLQYDTVNQALQVTILACHDLPEMMGSNVAENGTCQSNLNPYVKLRILPDNQHRVKTRVLRGTRNPFYDETFTMYGITEGNIKNYSLYLAVLAFDRYSRDLILGEAVYNLTGEQADFINNNQKLSTTLKLKARHSFEDKQQGKRGQVLVSMAHNVHSNSINLAVLKMKDLPKDEAIGLMDPYVKIYMLVNGQRVAKQKTHVKKKTRDPVFNESFSFDLTTQRRGSGGQDATGRKGSSPTLLEAVTFQLLIMNHDGVTRNEVIGQCVLDTESPLLQQIQSSPGRQIAEWHEIQA